LVTLNTVFDRVFDYGMLKRIDPDPTSGIGKDFAQRKEFYSALFVPPRWHLAQKITSNDGNVICIFRREAQPSEKRHVDHPRGGREVGNGLQVPNSN
jgi:hypothetical protein